MPPKNHVAFTLIELARAKVKAHAIKCIANQKQQYLGYHMYADDNTDRFPMHGDWATEGGFVRTNVKTKPVEESSNLRLHHSA